MPKWKRKKQETGGDYFFDGKLYVTKSVFEEIPAEEVAWMIRDIQAFAQENDGADYLVEYAHLESGERIWIIDQVSRSALKQGLHPEEHHYFTVLYPHEY